MATDTETRIHALITKKFSAVPYKPGREPKNFEQARLVDDLDLDSLDLVELIMAIEEDFHIEITDGEAEAFSPDNCTDSPKRVSDLAAFVDGKMKERAHG